MGRITSSCAAGAPLATDSKVRAPGTAGSVTSSPFTAEAGSMPGAPSRQRPSCAIAIKVSS